MQQRSRSGLLENFAGGFFLLLTLLMPLKYGTIAVMPEAASFYPERLFDYIYISWPAATFGIFSGFSLLLSLLACREKIRMTPLALCGALFAVAIPLAALWGKIISRNSFYADAMLLHILGIASCIGSAFLLVNRNPAWKNRILYTIAAGTFLLTFSAFHQYFFGFKEMQEFAKMQESQGIVLSDAIKLKLLDGRVYGAMSSANLLAGFMLCALPLFIASAAEVSRKFEPQKLSLKIFLAVSLILGAGTLFMTKTRGAFLALAVTCVIWIFSYKKISRLCKVILLSCIIAVLISGAFYIKLRGRGFGSMAERVSYLNSSLVMLRERPLSGHGWGEFFYRHMELKNTNSNESAHDPHNAPVSFAVHTGIFGGLLFLAAFLIPLWNLWKRRDELSLIDQAVLWGGIAGFLHMLSDINLQSPAVICIAMLIITVTQKNDGEKPVLHTIFRYLFAAMLAVVGAVSVYGSTQYTRGDVALSCLEDCVNPQTSDKFHLATPYNVERHLKNVNSLRPDHPFALNLAASFYLAHRNFDRAEQLFLESLALDKRRPGVLMKLSSIAEQKGDIQKAQELKNQAIKLFPSNPDYRKK
ncbi:MAG: O-antigen ligase family protein [Lentisphaeria bacterium]|nr:O-antigen ligase family protein [Lentisphaeria bacterium]